MESSFCEKPERHVPRRRSDYLMLEAQKQKVHSLVDKGRPFKLVSLASLNPSLQIAKAHS
jgi:hypothetical protein